MDWKGGGVERERERRGKIPLLLLVLFSDVNTVLSRSFPSLIFLLLLHRLLLPSLHFFLLLDTHSMSRLNFCIVINYDRQLRMDRNILWAWLIIKSEDEELRQSKAWSLPSLNMSEKHDQTRAMLNDEHHSSRTRTDDHQTTTTTTGKVSSINLWTRSNHWICL